MSDLKITIKDKYVVISTNAGPFFGEMKLAEFLAPEVDRFIAELRAATDKLRAKNRPHKKIGDY